MQQEQDCLQLNEQINTAFIRLIALSADNFQVQLNKPKRYDVNNRPMQQQQNKITSHTPCHVMPQFSSIFYRLKMLKRKC